MTATYTAKTRHNLGFSGFRHVDPCCSFCTASQERIPGVVQGGYGVGVGKRGKLLPARDTSVGTLAPAVLVPVTAIIGATAVLDGPRNNVSNARRNLLIAARTAVPLRCLGRHHVANIEVLIREPARAGFHAGAEEPTGQRAMLDRLCFVIGAPRAVPPRHQNNLSSSDSTPRSES